MNECKAKSAKGKGTQDEVRRTPGTNFQESSPRGVFCQRTHLTPPAMSRDSTCEMLPTRKAHQRLCAQDFHWGWSCKYPCLKFQAPEEKHIFSINHIVCTNSSGTVSHSTQLGNVGTLLKSKFTNTSQGPTFQAGSSKDRSLTPATLTLFYTLIHPCITYVNFHQQILKTKICCPSLKLTFQRDFHSSNIYLTLATC